MKPFVNINEDLLVKTSDGQIPLPCDAYDEDTKKCKISNEYCDTCYSDSLEFDI